MWLTFVASYLKIPSGVEASQSGHVFMTDGRKDGWMNSQTERQADINAIKYVSPRMERHDHFKKIIIIMEIYFRLLLQAF